MPSKLDVFARVLVALIILLLLLAGIGIGHIIQWMRS